MNTYDLEELADTDTWYKARQLSEHNITAWEPDTILRIMSKLYFFTCNTSHNSLSFFCQDHQLTRLIPCTSCRQRSCDWPGCSRWDTSWSRNSASLRLGRLFVGADYRGQNACCTSCIHLQKNKQNVFDGEIGVTLSEKYILNKNTNVSQQWVI